MNKVKVQESKIHGLGLFADQEFNEGDMIGLAHYNGVPSEIIGKYHNHSDNPNAHSVVIGNKRYLAALRPLRKGEEITVDYRQQPDLEQPEEFRKGGLVSMPKPSKKGLASKRYSRDLTATNRLLTKNKLLQKPKSKKNKIYDPNAKYYQTGGTSDPKNNFYTVQGSDGVYRKVGNTWEVDWNRSGNFQPLSKGDVAKRTAVLNSQAKPLYDSTYDDIYTTRQSAYTEKPKAAPVKNVTPQDKAVQEKFDKAFAVTGKSNMEVVEDKIQKGIDDYAKYHQEQTGKPLTQEEYNDAYRDIYNRAYVNAGVYKPTMSGPTINPYSMKQAGPAEKPQEFWDKAGDIISNPMTSAGFLIRGQAIPDYMQRNMDRGTFGYYANGQFHTERNPLDLAVADATGLSLVNDARNVYKGIENRDVAQAGLGALGFIPGVTELKNAGKAIKFAGPMKHTYQDVPEVLNALRQRGQYWDNTGAVGKDLLHPDMINYHGTYSGRPLVEVRMPDGSSEMFYKSSGWAKKAGEGVDGTTEGMWQVFGGHADTPKTSNWFIKDDNVVVPGLSYKDYYGSNTFKSMAENMDNALMQKLNFKTVDELDNAFNFKNRFGDVDSYTPKKQTGGTVELDGYRFKKDANGNWTYESGAPVTDRGMIQRLTYEAKPVGSPVVQSAPKGSLKPIPTRSENLKMVSDLSKSPRLEDQEKAAQLSELQREQDIFNPQEPDIIMKPKNMNDLKGYEFQVNRALGFPMDKAHFAAQAAAGDVNEEVDNFRHPLAGRYVAEGIADATGNIPYISPALGFIGSNLLGAGHEFMTLINHGKDNRSMLTRLAESGEDLYNNYVGAKVGASDMTPEEKTNYLLYLSYNNKLPDGIVSEGKPKKGTSNNVYFKKGPNDPGKYKSSYQYGGIVQLDGYRFKKDDSGNWFYESGAPVTDRALIQRLTYEAKPVGSPVVQGAPKPVINQAVWENAAGTSQKNAIAREKQLQALKVSPVLADQEKAKQIEQQRAASEAEYMNKLRQSSQHEQPLDMMDWLWGAAAVAPVVAPGLWAAAESAGTTALPYIEGALNTSLPGMASVPGATIGNVLGAGFAADAVVNRIPEIPGQLLRGEYGDATTNAITSGLDLAGAGLISPIYQGAKTTASELGRFIGTEEGLLSNTYRINPFAFKPNPEAYYHRSPDLNNIINQETGMLQGFGQSEAGKTFTAEALRPSQGINLKRGANSQLYFSKGVPLDYGRYNRILDPKTGKMIAGQGYRGPYIAEVKGVPMGASTKGRAPGVEPTGIGSYAVSKRPISLDETKFYKEHWLHGYKEVPKELPGSPNSTSEIQKAGFIDFKGMFQKYPKGPFTSEEIQKYKETPFFKKWTAQHNEDVKRYGDDWPLSNFAEEALKEGKRHIVNPQLYGGDNYGIADYIMKTMVPGAVIGTAGLYGLTFSPPAVRSRALRSLGVTGVPGGLSDRDTTINLTNAPMDYAKVNQFKDGRIIIGGEFIEDANNTVRKAKDWKNATDTYSDKLYPSKDIESFYGVEDGKFKVGKASDFKPDTEIVPRRFGAVNIKKAVLNGNEMRLLDEKNKPIYQNTPNTGKFILYSPSTGKSQFNYINTGKSGVNKVNRFLKQNKDAQYIHLDNGRYEFYGINEPGLTNQDFMNYYQQDLERKGNPGYNLIIKQDGGEPKGRKKTKFQEGTYDPNETAGYMLDEQEVVVPGQASAWGKARRAYQEKNPEEEFVERKKRQYVRQSNKGLNKLFGVSTENFNPDVEQNFRDEYDYLTNTAAVKKVSRQEGWNPNKRKEYVNDLNETQRQIVANSKYGSKLQPNYWDRALAGVATLVSPFSSGIQRMMNEGYMPGLTKDESQAILNSEIFGIPMGGAEILTPLSMQGQNLANYAKNRGLSTGSDYKELPAIASGESMANVDDTDVMGLDLPGLIELGFAPQAGVKLMQGLYKGAKQLPSALDNFSMFPKQPVPLEGYDLTKGQATKSLLPELVEEPRVISNATQQVQEPWKMQPMSGLHLKSTMTTNPKGLHTQVAKDGTINVENALKFIKNNEGQDKYNLVVQALGENIPKKMDYNQFRKVVQDQLIPLDKTIVSGGEYGVDNIGYELGSPEIKTEKIILSNKDKFGRGADEHGNPEETLGHVHMLYDEEEPGAAIVTQIQADAFQGPFRLPIKTKENAEFNLKAQQERYERMKDFHDKIIKISDDTYQMPDGQKISKNVYDNMLIQQKESVDLAKALFEGFDQRQLLDKNHQERYLQEIVQYVAERGDANRIKLPTPETANKIQNYTGIETFTPEMKALRQKIIDASDSGDNYAWSKAQAEYDKALEEARLRSQNVDGSIIKYKKNKLKELEATLGPEDIAVKKLKSEITILEKYSENPKIIKKLYGIEPKMVTDSKGNTWYEFNIPYEFKEGPSEIKAFNYGGVSSKLNKFIR